MGVSVPSSGVGQFLIHTGPSVQLNPDAMASTTAPAETSLETALQFVKCLSKYGEHVISYNLNIQ